MPTERAGQAAVISSMGEEVPWGRVSKSVTARQLLLSSDQLLLRGEMHLTVRFYVKSHSFNNHSHF